MLVSVTPVKRGSLSLADVRTAGSCRPADDDSCIAQINETRELRAIVTGKNRVWYLHSRLPDSLYAAGTPAGDLAAALELELAESALTEGTNPRCAFMSAVSNAAAKLGQPNPRTEVESNAGELLAQLDASLEMQEFQFAENGLQLPSMNRLSAACDLIERALRVVAMKDRGIPSEQDEELQHRRSAQCLRQALNLIRGDLAIALRIPPDSEIEIDVPSGGEYEEYAEQRFWMIHDALHELPVKFRLDIEMAYRNDPAVTRIPEIAVAYPGIKAVGIQRFAHLFEKAQVPLIGRMLSSIAASRYSIDIHPGATLGTSLFIDHALATVIGQTTEIGSHVMIYHGVTCGAKSFKYDDTGCVVKGNKRHPTILDDVVIYSNTKIYGGETIIGRGTVIGADLEISSSIPDWKQVYRDRHGVVHIKDRPQPKSPKLHDAM
jgi:serine acetyltransferase